MIKGPICRLDLLSGRNILYMQNCVYICKISISIGFAQNVNDVWQAFCRPKCIVAYIFAPKRYQNEAVYRQLPYPWVQLNREPWHCFVCALCNNLAKHKSERLTKEGY